jgi:hypothetical protein
MYDPSAIVDLRRNTSFSRVYSSKSLQPGQITASDNSDLRVLCTTPVRLPSQRTSASFNEPTNMGRSNAVLSMPATGSCRGCSHLSHRVSELEFQLNSTQSRLRSFEGEVLAVMKSISNDIRELKSGESNSNSVFWKPDNLAPTEESCRLTEPSRAALTEACMALERLIADARSRTSSVDIHS